MSKLILWLSFIAVALLFACSLISPASPALWLASTATNYMIIRGVLMVMLLALIMSDPPRYVWFRVFVGFVSIGLAAWSLSSTYQNIMPILDGAAFLVASIAMGIAALEFRLYNDRSEEVTMHDLRERWQHSVAA
jgi:hypothetical protein